MRTWRSRATWLAGAALLLAGCAGALGKGQLALRQGDDRAAIRHFEDVLREHPEQAAARFGLAVALYRLGDLARADAHFERVAVGAPQHRDAQLYLALTALRRGDLGTTDNRLRTFRSRAPHPRLVVLTERALRLLTSASLSPETTDFVVASFEGAIDWERDVREALAAPRMYAEPTWAVYGDHRAGYPYGWFHYFPAIPYAP